LSDKINIERLTESRTSEIFPNVLITNPTDVVPTVVEALEKGDMQLIVEWQGKKKVVARISESADNIDKLLRVIRHITYSKSQDERIVINSIPEYLDCII